VSHYSLNTRGGRICAFIERYLTYPDGQFVGKKFSLEHWQIKFVLDVFDNKHRTHKAILSMARKNGKTALIAAILAAFLFGPEARQNAQIVSGAMSKDQAGIVFNFLSAMVRASPELSARSRIVPSKKEVYGLSKNVQYRALSSEDTTAHGLSPLFALLDEVGQVKGPNSAFVDAITTAQGAHGDNATLMVISTQAATDADLLSIWIDDAVKGEDKQTVVHLYCADADCDLMDETQWRKANPAIDTFRDFGDVSRQANNAKRMPTSESSFRNLILNQRVQAFNPFVSKSVWLVNGGDANPDAFYKSPVYAGLDLSSRQDLTALALVCFCEGKWHVKVTHWTPSKGVAERARRDRQPYDVWVSSGALRTAGTASIRYQDVTREISELIDGMDIKAMAYDRWRIEDFKQALAEDGLDFPLEEFGQGFRDMSPALDALSAALLNDQMLHGMNPILTMCAANAVTEKDASGNIKLTKAKSNGRIDGMVALAMAMGVASKSELPKASVYESRGIMLL
jgi:phage terminase large subunit-like protein